jgi:Photosynthesis affected mutant 68
MPSKSSRNSLPFEPQQKKKKTSKTSPIQSQTTAEKPKTTSVKANQTAIPAVVSKRMVRRMGLFSGIPTALGMSSFFVSYSIVSHHWFKLPTTVVLLISLGLFGLGVLGLSYGILSTSWDEERVGTRLGWEEFNLNFGRMTSAWRSAKKEIKED